MNIAGTLPQEGNVKLFVPGLSTQRSTRPKQNIFNVVLIVGQNWMKNVFYDDANLLLD